MSFRRDFITKPIFSWARGVLPAMSETEREALEAGDGENNGARVESGELRRFFTSPRLRGEVASQYAMRVRGSFRELGVSMEPLTLTLSP